MSKAVQDILEYVEKQSTSVFDHLLNKTFYELLLKKAALQTNINYQQEMLVLGIPLPDGVKNIIDELENTIQITEDKLRSELELLLEEASEEEVEKLVRRSKFATRKPISGATLLLNGKREIAVRFREETAESLIQLSPLKILDKVKNSEDPNVVRFVEIYKPRQVSENIEKWIDNNVKDPIFNSRCKEHYEEMKNEVFTEDILEGIAKQWIVKGLERRITKEELDEKIKELTNLLNNDKALTIL